jgi:PAS domain S-box-containing protein
MSAGNVSTKLTPDPPSGEEPDYAIRLALLAAIVESSDDAIVSKTLEGQILSWNTGAERIFGYSAAEVIGQPITIIIPPELRDQELNILERVRRGERIDHFTVMDQARGASSLCDCPPAPRQWKLLISRREWTFECLVPG